MNKKLILTYILDTLLSILYVIALFCKWKWFQTKSQQNHCKWFYYVRRKRVEWYKRHETSMKSVAWDKDWLNSLSSLYKNMWSQNAVIWPFTIKYPKEPCYKYNIILSLHLEYDSCVFLQQVECGVAAQQQARDDGDMRPAAADSASESLSETSEPGQVKQTDAEETRPQSAVSGAAHLQMGSSTERSSDHTSPPKTPSAASLAESVQSATHSECHKTNLRTNLRVFFWDHGASFIKTSYICFSISATCCIFMQLVDWLKFFARTEIFIDQNHDISLTHYHICKLF